jgi:hypothetical protein
VVLVEVREPVVEENRWVHFVWDGECEDALCCVLYRCVDYTSCGISIRGVDGSPAPRRRIWLIGVAGVLLEVHRYEVRWHW